MIHRLMVVDGRDAVAAQEKLAQGRAKYSDHEWVRFNADNYASPDDAYKSLVAYLRSPAMFVPGRVIYCFGLPMAKDYMSDLAKQLPLIDDTVSFIVVCRLDDLGAPMVKAIRSLEKNGKARVFPPVEVDEKNVLDWIAAKAEAIGIQMDKDARRVLADVTRSSPSRIQNELRKLQGLTSNNIITAQHVMMAAFGEGEAEITQIGDALLFGRMEQAHELLQRILDRGESPLMIGGYLEDWATRLALAESCGCNSETVKMKVGSLMKWESSGEGQETVYSAKYGTYTRKVGKRVPMFGNPNAFYYTGKGLRESGRKAGWAIRALELAGKMQMEIREDKDAAAKLFHRFLIDVDQAETAQPITSKAAQPSKPAEKPIVRTAEKPKNDRVETGKTGEQKTADFLATRETWAGHGKICPDNVPFRFKAVPSNVDGCGIDFLRILLEGMSPERWQVKSRDQVERGKHPPCDIIFDRYEPYAGNTSPKGTWEQSRSGEKVNVDARDMNSLNGHYYACRCYVRDGMDSPFVVYVVKASALKKAVEKVDATMAGKYEWGLNPVPGNPYVEYRYGKDPHDCTVIKILYYFKPGAFNENDIWAFPEKE